MRETLPIALDPADLLVGMPDPEAVRRAEQFLLTLPQIDLHTTKVVHGWVCAQTIFIPADTVLTGAQTNIDNICILFGDITVTTDDGPKRLTGYHVIPANAGFKRAGKTHADTWWTTVWHTELTDPQAIEDELTNEADMLQTRRTGITYQAMPALNQENE